MFDLCSWRTGKRRAIPGAMPTVSYQAIGGFWPYYG